MNTSIFLPFLLLYVKFVHSSTSRKLSAGVDPDCGKTCKHLGLNNSEYNNIVHVIGRGEKDALHYVWSSVGAPAILIAKTANDVDLKVDWKKLTSKNSSNGLQFTGKVHYSFAAIMTRLFEYNDTSKDAQFIMNDDTITYDLDKLTWNDVNDTVDISSDKVSATFKTSNESTKMLHNGQIIIKMFAFGRKDRQKELPHLLSTANTSLIDFTIDGLNGSYKNSRFVAEMVFVSLGSAENKNGKHIDYKRKRTIDDEYTPSVFETYNLQSAESRMKNSGGYMQWKPISYLTSDREYKDSTPIKVGKFNSSVNMHEIPHSVAKAFYGSELSKAELANLTITFGVEKGIDFYTTSNYSTWTVAVGYGDPPKDNISLTVILVISIGLGLPLLMLLGGGMFTLVKKLKRGNTPDMLIVDD